MVLGLDHACVKPALEEMPDALVAPVEAHRVEAVQPLHPLGELRTLRLDQQVEMVVEDRPDPDAPAEAAGDVDEQVVPRPAVEIVEEDLPLLHAAADDVIVRRARQLRARDARHSGHGTGGSG
jgi:hypothetical protein